MTVRRYIPVSDYDTIKGWWTRRGTEAPQPILLPEIGVLAEHDGNPVACAFLYQDVSGHVAMVEWEATNPDAKAMSCLRGLNMVFDFFETFARDYGYTVVLSWVAEGRGDGRLLENRKWVKCPGERHALMAFNTQPQEAECQQ